MRKGLFFVVLVLVFGAIALFYSTRHMNALAKEERIPAPVFEVRNINGDTCRIPNPANRYTVILFWTTWCPHCSNALKEMDMLAAKYDKDLDFCAIGVGETEDKIRNYISRRDVSMHVAADPSGYIARQYYVRGVPTIAIVDKDGYVFDYGYSLYPMVSRVLAKIKEDGHDKG